MVKTNPLKSLIANSINDALNLDWGQVTYKRSSWVITAAVLIGAALFTTLLIRLWQGHKSTSYYFTIIKIDKRHNKGITFGLVRCFTWSLAIVSLFFLSIALTDPVFFITNATEYIESREVIYINDSSASNGFKVSNGKISRGELGRETLEKLIVRRKDKKDRAALILFATNSDIWSGFTTSLESLMFSVSRSPLAMAPEEAPKMWPGAFILKRGQFLETDIDQGTNLHLGLESAIYLFDRKGSPEITKELKQNPTAKMRSVVISTDGAADKDPEPQFRELKKRRIIPYLIFLDPGRQIEKMIYGDYDPKAQLPQHLLAMVRRYGGEYFFAKDSGSIDRISARLDQLRGVKYTKKVSVKERELYFIPLSIAVLFAIMAAMIRILFFRVWRIV